MCGVLESVYTITSHQCTACMLLYAEFMPDLEQASDFKESRPSHVPAGEFMGNEHSLAIPWNPLMIIIGVNSLGLSPCVVHACRWLVLDCCCGSGLHYFGSITACTVPSCVIRRGSTGSKRSLMSITKC